MIGNHFTSAPASFAHASDNDSPGREVPAVSGGACFEGDEYSAAVTEMMRETLARAQAVNRLHEAIGHLTADEIGQLVGAVHSGAWRPA